MLTFVTSPQPGDSLALAIALSVLTGEPVCHLSSRPDLGLEEALAGLCGPSIVEGTGLLAFPHLCARHRVYCANPPVSAIRRARQERRLCLCTHSLLPFDPREISRTGVCLYAAPGPRNLGVEGEPRGLVVVTWPKFFGRSLAGALVTFEASEVRWGISLGGDPQLLAVC